MDDLLFCFHATAPIFLTMILGLFFRRIGLMDEAFVKKINKFVFVAALPVLTFEDLALVDFAKMWDGRFVLFCFLATFCSVLLAALVSCGLRDKSIQGEFVQVSYRSSAAILGIALIQNLYGDAGMGPLMIIGTVPLYNVMAVLVLSVMKPERGRLDGRMLAKTCREIATNPIILGIAAGILWSVLKIPMPVVLEKTVKNVSALATPLGLMAMGASIDFKQTFGKIRPAALAALIKLVGLAAIFLPLAVRLGFTDEKLVAILVMLGSASTVSCYIMAKNMGHEGTLTSSVVMLTTLLAAVTLTGWLYLLRVLGLI